MNQKDKYLWFTDTHLFPWKRKTLLNTILDAAPKGVFISGDISHSATTCLGDLEYLGKRVGRKVYFVLGNHDFWFSSLEQTKKEVRYLCSKYKNLIWLSDIDFESLNEEVALIGTDGWYDGNLGNPEHLKYTFDWRLIEETKNLSSLKERIDFFKQLSKTSTEKISKALCLALENHKTIYLITHFPPWREANRDPGTFMEPFWLPYNVNLTLGEELERVMAQFKKRNLKVIAGHTHCAVQIHVSRNIECVVGKNNLTGSNFYI